MYVCGARHIGSNSELYSVVHFDLCFPASDFFNACVLLMFGLLERPGKTFL